MQCATGGYGAGRVENKRAYGRVEPVAVLGHEKVAAPHGAAGCTQAAAAGVLKRFAGAQQGLLANHAQALDFLAVTALILDHPMAGNQLNRDLARVGDRDRVRKSEHILQRIALVCNVMGQHVNLNGVGGHPHMLTATIQG